jgi:hypothetical protein
VLDRGLAITKDTLAWVVTANYVIYLISASIAWWGERKADRYDDCGHVIELENF